MPQVLATLEKPAAQSSSTSESWWSRHQRKIIPYLFIAPTMSIFTLFVLIPIVYAFYISFFDWNGIGVPEFIGAKNYTSLFADPVFLTSLKNTVVYTLGVVPVSMVLGLLAAIGLNRKRLPGRALLRSVYFIPVVISAVATGTTATWIFGDSFGVINKIIVVLGGSKIQWLSSSNTAMLAVIFTTIWVRLGFCMLIYLAGLQSIPDDLIEAARVDGATPFQQFTRITVPLLKPTTFLLLILNIVYSFEAFDLVYVMTSGGPGYATTVLTVYVYNIAFQTQRMGYASAVGIVLMIILVFVTWVQWRVSNEGGKV
ncbi:MAG: ABC transporter permease subunit [Chloroflexi bacterium]|nr:ABC transporter permease subunit [Chloroflexota bacterium]